MKSGVHSSMVYTTHGYQSDYIDPLDERSLNRTIGLGFVNAYSSDFEDPETFAVPHRSKTLAQTIAIGDEELDNPDNIKSKNRSGLVTFNHLFETAYDDPSTIFPFNNAYGLKEFHAYESEYNNPAGIRSGNRISDIHFIDAYQGVYRDPDSINSGSVAYSLVQNAAVRQSYVQPDVFGSNHQVYYSVNHVSFDETFIDPDLLANNHSAIGVTEFVAHSSQYNDPSIKKGDLKSHATACLIAYFEEAYDDPENVKPPVKKINKRIVTTTTRYFA